MERLQYFASKFKFLVKVGIAFDLFLVLLIVLVGTGGFGLGRLSMVKENKKSIEIVYPETKSNLAGIAEAADKIKVVEGSTLPSGEGRVVASKNGTKYHLPWCPGAERILESNKIWFDSIEEAEKAGYSPAANCKGI